MATPARARAARPASAARSAGKRGRPAGVAAAESRGRSKHLRLLVITELYRDAAANGSEVFCCELIDELRSRFEIDVLARAAEAGRSKRKPRWMIDDDTFNDPARLESWLRDHIDPAGYDLVYNLGALIFGSRIVSVLRQSEPLLPVVNHFQALLGPYSRAEGLSEPMSAANEVDQLNASSDALLNIFASQAEHEAAAAAGMPLDPSAVAVIPNGLRFPRFVRRASILSRARAAKRPFVIVTAGRFSDFTKGADLVYRAFADLHCANPNVFLLSIGNSDRFQSLLRDLPKRSYRFQKWMPRRQFLETLAAADLVVLPSRYEPFGLIALEALACGVPVLATDVGGLREIVHHERFGVLSRLDDGSYGLYRGMSRLAADREQLSRMGAAGREFVRKEYAIDRIATLIDRSLRAAWLRRDRVAIAS